MPNQATSSRISFDYTQPLVRGLRTDDTRRQIEIAKKNLALTDVQFRQRATDVITKVEQAYWELVHALKSLPARYFVEVSRDVFVRGGGWPATWHVPVLLTVLSAVFLLRAWVSLRKCKSRRNSDSEARSEFSL